ncbi:MAG: response regulator transcription factor, partial [Candidatus Binatia bacterium]
MAGEKKIFIAEDDQHFCELYQMALGIEGYNVLCAYNGKDALEKIPGEIPDLIILDVVMPEMTGLEVCRRLRELPDFALTPIIMLTALATDDDKIKGYNVGADDYLTKPFPLRVLKAKVRSLIERRDANKGVELEPAMNVFSPQPTAVQADAP